MERTTVRWALAGLSLSALLASLGSSVANVALPTLALAFGATFREVQWVVLAYLVALTVSTVVVGRLGDRVGRRRLLVSGLVLFTVASVGCGVAPSLPLLVLARALQGLGAAAMMALTVALVGEILPKGRTGSAMGLLGTTSAMGTALGPSLGGVLIDQVGWRATFLVLAPLGLIALALVHRFLPADRPALALDRRGRWSLLRDPVLGAGLAASLLVSTVLMSTLVAGPFYLSRSLGLAPAMIGAVMSIGPIAAAAIGLPSGRLVDRVGAERMTLVGLAGIAAGMGVLAVSPETLGVAGYVAPIVAVTSSYALFQTANNTAVMRNVDPSARGVVSGVLSLSRNLGLIAGASLMGTVLAIGAGADDPAQASPGAVATGTRTTFAVAAALIGLALAIVIGARALVARRPSR